MINDAHIHFGQSGMINQSIPSFEHLEAFRAKHNIGNMLVFPFEVEPEKTNVMLSEYAKRNSWLKPLYWLSRKQPLRHINGFVGCKFHGAYDNMPISAPDYREALELLHDNGALLLVHCGRYLEGRIESNTSYLHALQIAKEYSRIKVILGHMGGTDTTVVKRAILEGKELENVYFESSGITTPYTIEFAIKHLPPKRILFGSDSPWCSFNSMYYNVADAEIKESEKDAILRSNFSELIQ